MRWVFFFKLPEFANQVAQIQEVSQNAEWQMWSNHPVKCLLLLNSDAVFSRHAMKLDAQWQHVNLLPVRRNNDNLGV